MIQISFDSPAVFYENNVWIFAHAESKIKFENKIFNNRLNFYFEFLFFIRYPNLKFLQTWDGFVK